MIYLGELVKKEYNSYVVGFVHYMPFHEVHGMGKSKEELEQEGILVDSIPEPQQIEGKSAVLHFNPETKDLWYEYEDKPKTPEELQQEKIESLEQSIAELTTATAMMMGGM